MRTPLLTTFALVLALMLAAGPGYAFSLPQLLGRSEEQNLDTFKLIRVGDLKTMMDHAPHKVHVYDANVRSTRAEFGVIPGATLLDSDDSYRLSVLPSNKGATLVFYCANIH